MFILQADIASKIFTSIPRHSLIKCSTNNLECLLNTSKNDCNILVLNVG